jgi:hypothetical protein
VQREAEEEEEVGREGGRAATHLLIGSFHRHPERWWRLLISMPSDADILQRS